MVLDCCSAVAAGVFRGAQAYRVSQTVGTATTPNRVAFDGVFFDTDSFFDLGADDTLITVPDDGLYELYAAGTISLSADPTKKYEVDCGFGTVEINYLGHDLRQFTGVLTTEEQTIIPRTIRKMLAGSTVRCIVDCTGIGFAWTAVLSINVGITRLGDIPPSS